jgi:pSer/pThr/pTyr-binding forkhead associated (FHA) protein
LSYEGGNYYLTDNNSTNGTFVNDFKITKTMINTQDVIRMGAIFIKIQF